MYNETSLMAWIEKMKINRESAHAFDKAAVFAGISLRRRVRYVNVFNLINKVLAKNIKEMKQEDVDKFFFYLRSSAYADETNRCTWIIFRKICKHFVKLKFKRYKAFLVKKYKYPREVLKKEEVMQMLQFCKTRREWLIVVLLYNSGFRPDEFLHLKHTDISFDGDGAILKVNGKTGERIIRLANIIDCQRELLAYLSTIEGRLLFNFGIKYLQDTLKRIGWQAGLKHRVTPYLFRHSCLTLLAQYLTESQMCAYAGWIQGSSQAQIYVHLSARDISPKIIDINRLLQMQGQERDAAICQTIETLPREQLTLMQTHNRTTYQTTNPLWHPTQKHSFIPLR